MAADYRFVRQPRWLVGHVIALLAIVLFVSLGLWQLRRHDERSALDSLLEARMNETPLLLAEALEMPVADVELRRIAATGVFDPANEVVLQARTLNGRSGHNVITPLVGADGSAVLVNRGWVSIDAAGPPVVDAPPPAGSLTVIGIARKSEVRANLGPVDPAFGVLDRVSRVDIDRLALQIEQDLAPFYLQMLEPAPPAGFPLPLPEPEPGGGPPHLPYAVQWFVFAGVVAIGYPLLLRTTAHKAVSSEIPSTPSYAP